MNVKMKDIEDHINKVGPEWGVNLDSTFEELDKAIANGMPWPFVLDMQWWGHAVFPLNPIPFPENKTLKIRTCHEWTKDQP